MCSAVSPVDGENATSRRNSSPTFNCLPRTTSAVVCRRTRPDVLPDCGLAAWKQRRTATGISAVCRSSMPSRKICAMGFVAFAETRGLLPSSSFWLRSASARTQPCQHHQCRLLRPLPYPNPIGWCGSERLARSPVLVCAPGFVSYQNFVDWRAQQTVFEHIGAFQPTGVVPALF